MNVEGKQLTRVNPVHIDTRNDRRDREYKFGKVVIEDWDGECSITGVATRDVPDHDCYMWQYGAKPTVYIFEEGVYVEQDGLGSEAHRQAYFALSYLDGRGLVEGWKQL